MFEFLMVHTVSNPPLINGYHNKQVLLVFERNSLTILCIFPPNKYSLKQLAGHLRLPLKYFFAMTRKERTTQRALHNDLSPDFDLDEYLEEKSNPQTSSKEIEEPDDPSYRMKNVAIFATMVLMVLLWFFDWSPKAAFNAFFGDDQATLAEAPNVNVDIPEINIDIPDFDFDVEAPNSVAENLGSVTDYLLELQNQNILPDKLSAFNARQLHDNGVPISYILQMDHEGFLGKFSFVHISEFYKNNIPMEYLHQMDEAGFLDQLSFVHVIEFYKNQIPFSYLQRMDQAGYLNRFSFVHIIEFYKNDVPFDYLQTLDDAGYLDELSFVHITEYYKNGVTVEFLDELKQTGLYDNLSFVDVVELFKDQN